jgi:rhodanese-related sulfurtransferase
MKRLDVLAKEIGIIAVASLLLAFSYNAFSPKPLPLIRSAAETQAPDSLINALAEGFSQSPPASRAQKAVEADAENGARGENSLSGDSDTPSPKTSPDQEEKSSSSAVSSAVSATSPPAPTATGKAAENSGVAGAAQNSGVGAPASPKALDIRFDQLEKLLANPEVLLIDARPAHEFEQGHISGAINIFTPDFEQSIHRIIGLPREKPIVAYCGGGACELSHELAEHLTRMGFQRVFVYVGGWNEWKEKKR